MVEDVRSLQGKKIFVGLSGGVDSSVTASLLQKAGAQVTGVFIKGWYPEGLPCTWASDRRDAMAVAAQLHIPFITYDASNVYKESVIEYLLREYYAGRTPNPDIMCNREVKFGAFYEFAMQHGADHIATGHYAITKEGRLYRAHDKTKDQSYFLWAVKKEVLAKVLFPLGGHTKQEVRAYAKKNKLVVADKRDSQGICFLGNISIEDFLISEFGTREGDAVTEDGVRVGSHNGALLHTLGERVALENATQGPWYVVAKDVANNTLTVSRSQHTATTKENITLSHINVLSAPRSDEILVAQYRYHGPLVLGTWDETSQSFRATSEVIEPIAQGQSLVVYKGAECLLGGIIE